MSPHATGMAAVSVTELHGRRRLVLVDLARQLGNIGAAIERDDYDETHLPEDVDVQRTDELEVLCRHLKASLKHHLTRYFMYRNRVEMRKSKVTAYRSILENLNSHEASDSQCHEVEEALVGALRKVVEHLDESCIADDSRLLAHHWGAFRWLRDRVDVLAGVQTKCVCTTCYDDIVDMCLIPCGHAFCSSCAMRFRECPMCRGGVERQQRIFM